MDYSQNNLGQIPLDHFFSRLFGEVLSQPEFGFHADAEAGRIIAELVESARRFRQTLYPDGVEESWDAISREYYELVRQGLLGALYVTSWQDEQRDAVFLAPAYTFLMRNRWTDYQFWLDVGSTSWWERLEQPLTHPYVLSRNYPADQVWTDSMEVAARDDALRRLIVGLVRRVSATSLRRHCRAGRAGLRTARPLLRVLQQLQQQPLSWGGSA